MSSVPEISIDALKSALATGGYLLDVREPDELAKARVAGGVPMPLDRIADRVSELPTDAPVHVICASGGRSMMAAEFLRSNGIDAINVAGGTKAWIAAGNPIESGS